MSNIKATAQTKHKGYSISVENIDDSLIYKGTAKCFPNILAFEDTQRECVLTVKDAIDILLEIYEEEGIKPPEPE